MKNDLKEAMGLGFFATLCVIGLAVLAFLVVEVIVYLWQLDDITVRYVMTLIPVVFVVSSLIIFAGLRIERAKNQDIK